MEILRHCAGGRWHRPVIVEMGGKNPAYVTATADLDVAAEGRHALGVRTVGTEVLGAVARVRPRRASHDALIERLIARTRALAVGDPRRAGTFTGPVIDAAAAKARFTAAVDDARAAGGSVVCGGGVLAGDGLDRGAYVEPTIVDGLARRPSGQPRRAVRAAAGRAPLRRSRRRAATKATRSTTGSPPGSTPGTAPSSTSSSSAPKRACSTPTGRAARPPAPGPASRASAGGKARARRGRAASGRTT